MNRTFTVLLFSCFCFNIVFSQNTDKLAREADYLFNTNKFEKALPILLQVLENNSGKILSPEQLNYKIAMCYYNSINEKNKSISYFEAYLEKTDTISESHYFLAQMYHLFNQFDNAIVEYKKFADYIQKEKLTSGADEVLEEVIQAVYRKIESCNYGKILIINPIDVIIQESELNSEHSEYAPVISPDESILAFTKRGPENEGRAESDGSFFEDIFLSTITDGSISHPKIDSVTAGFKNLTQEIKFSVPRSIGNKVNTPKHEAAIQFSYDKKKLYIYRNGNVYVSEIIENEWQKPTLIDQLQSVGNLKAFEPSVSVSINEDAIYISSDRPGGFGGLDLYKSLKDENGKWGPVTNLGPNINTPHDEDSPYIDPDGLTLYFSSKGHTSMGGYDVFKSGFDGKEWSAPQNMGYPLNSAGDDIFFMMTPRYNRGFYSSNKPGGKGLMDIYQLTFSNERSPLAELRGLVLKGDTLIPAYSKITIFDPVKNIDVASYSSDSLSGEYLLLFAHGKNYQVKVETDGFAPYTKNIVIPPQVRYYQFYQEVHHIHIKDKKGNVIGQKVSMADNLLDHSVHNLTDTNKVTMDDVTSSEELIKMLEKKEAKPIQEEIVDVKFYITEDSLVNLIEEGMVEEKYYQPVEEPIPTEIAKSSISGDPALPALVSNNDPKPDSTKIADPPKKIKYEFSRSTPISFVDPAKKNIDIKDVNAFVPSKYEQMKALKIKGILLTDKTGIDTLESVLLSGSGNLPVMEINDEEEQADPKEKEAKSFEKRLEAKDNSNEKEHSGETSVLSKDAPSVILLFEYAKQDIKAETEKELESFIDFLVKHPSIKIDIVGHADSKGSEEVNLRISKQRAQAIANYLSTHRIKKSRMKVIGRGEKEPVTPNENPDGSDNPSGRMLNRRVEFKLR